MNATVPEHDPEEMERSAVEADAPNVDKPALDVSEGDQTAAERAPSMDKPAPDVAAETGAGHGVDGPALEESGAEEPPMAWHRFLTSFWLWLAALYHAFQAGWMLWGGQYYAAEIRRMAYDGLPMLRAMDWALAVVTAVAAVLCVRSAVALRKRRSAGPRLLRWTYILLLAGQLGFAAGRYLIIGLTPLAASTLGPGAVYLALLLVNGAYYRRRRSCFAPLNQTGGHVS